MFDVNTSFQNLAIEWNTTQIEKVEAEITAWDGLANKVLLNDLVTVKYFTTLSEQLVYSIQGALKASTKIRSFQYLWLYSQHYQCNTCNSPNKH